MHRQQFTKDIFWTTLVVATLYSSYRYPLQINFSGTSPTYIDTPPILQISKYVIIIAAALLSIFSSTRNHITQKRFLFIIAYASIVAYPFIPFMYDGDFRHLQFPIVSLCALLISVAVPDVELESLTRFMKGLLFISISANAIQILLFLTIGRLPALAYENTIFIRFGGFLDDPNGFAAILFLLYGFLYHAKKTITNVICTASVILSIILTQSLTAISFYIFISLTLRLLRNPKATLALIVIALIALTAYVYFSDAIIQDTYTTFFSSKMESIEGHISWINLRNDFGILTTIIGAFDYRPSESWWIGSVNNYGLFWVSALFGLNAMYIFRLRALLRHNLQPDKVRAIFAIFIFSIYVLFGSFNFPFYQIFPINFILMTFICLVMLGKIRSNSVMEPPLLPLHNTVS